MIGGNVNIISKESLLEVYLKPTDEERKNFVNFIKIIIKRVADDRYC